MTEDDVVKFISDAAKGDVAATKRWLSQGAPVHIDFGDGRLSLLKLIASTPHTEVLRALLERGADANELMNDENRPLHSAATSGRLAAVDLLVKHGADVNARGVRGETPLRMALTMKHTAVARRLCELGADPDRADEHGITDRMVAAYENVPIPARQAMPASPPGGLRPPVGTGTAADLIGALDGKSADEIEALWRVLMPLINARVAAGESSPERAAALQQIMRDFDTARALPDLEDRTVEMRKVMARMNATFAPERRS